MRSAADLIHIPSRETPFSNTDHDFVASELELRANTELTRTVHQLTTEIHARLVLPADGGPEIAGDIVSHPTS